ncbi:hypothetical protein M5D96_004082 [Drosophila gunungcola]|uniref:Uncharacterized protein n=1 Tax=Drosophila gunungcola TaxID=103775 RepID=A0A9P9YTA2_9MUSC|nr:hypothetical protein M5D96_004082 [Drosophila gunungcola]
MCLHFLYRTFVTCWQATNPKNIASKEETTRTHTLGPKMSYTTGSATMELTSQWAKRSTRNVARARTVVGSCHLS